MQEEFLPEKGFAFSHEEHFREKHGIVGEKGGTGIRLRRTTCTLFPVTLERVRSCNKESLFHRDGSSVRVRPVRGGTKKTGEMDRYARK